jgi:hypothetical protein
MISAAYDFCFFSADAVVLMLAAPDHICVQCVHAQQNSLREYVSLLVTAICNTLLCCLCFIITYVHYRAYVLSLDVEGADEWIRQTVFKLQEIELSSSTLQQQQVSHISTVILQPHWL